MKNVGDILEHQGVKLKVVDTHKDETYNCGDCFFFNHPECENMLCMQHERMDEKEVAFIEVDE
ncbi:MAG: hypothetical protein E6767_18810 [Dysgonomonas sp.]|nr:hypothetical protein [Dysgonomonas sp.]